jgi:hypothetical protein
MDFWEILNCIVFVVHRLLSVSNDMIYGIPLPPPLSEEGEE